MKKLILSTSIISASIAMFGCSGSSHTDKWEEIKSSNEYQSSEKFNEHKNLFIPKEDTSDHVKDEYYVGYTTLDIVKKNRDNLPKDFYNITSVYSDQKIKYKDIPSIIYKDFGIVVEYINQKSSDENKKSVDPLTTDTETTTDTNIATNLNSLFETTTPSVDNPEEDMLEYKYSGDLKGLFDYITVSMDKKWEYDNETEKVYIYKYKTEKFELLQGKEEIQKSTAVTTATSGSSSDSGSGSSGTTQSIQFSSELNFWDDMQKNIENMLSEDAVSSFDPTQGTIIVTDSDFVLSKVRKYVEQLNSVASKQIVIDVQILNVKMNDSSNYGLNVNALNQSISSSIFGSSVTAGFDFANTSQNIGNTISLNNNKTGMNTLFHALNEFSTFKIANSINAITMNNKPVPIQVTTDTTYISSVSTETNTDNSSVSTETVNNDTVKEGITMTVTPKIFDQNVVLEYSMNLSVLDDLVSNGTNSVQTPIISSKNFTQRILAKNGQPIIVASFDSSNKTAGSKSPFKGNLWFLGGSEATSDKQEKILIIVTPYIVGN